MRHKRRDADRQHQQSCQGACLGKRHHAQAHRQRRPDNKADFVQHRLQRIGRLQLRLTAIQLGPARPHHRRHAWHAPGDGGEHKQRPVWRLQTRAQQHQQQRPATDQCRHRQNPPLPKTVHQPRHLRCTKRRGQRKRRRHRTGQAVAALQLRKHGDQADAGHGNRHARDHPGQHEGPGAGGVEQFAIGVGHGAGLVRGLHVAIRPYGGKGWNCWLNVKALSRAGSRPYLPARKPEQSPHK
ncbi:hypothetical protein D3C84_758740 [compost metagenome]